MKDASYLIGCLRSFIWRFDRWHSESLISAWQLLRVKSAGSDINRTASIALSCSLVYVLTLVYSLMMMSICSLLSGVIKVLVPLWKDITPTLGKEVSTYSILRTLVMEGW